MSQGCLDYTRRKNIYTNYICAALGADRLPIQNGKFEVYSNELEIIAENVLEILTLFQNQALHTMACKKKLKN